MLLETRQTTGSQEHMQQAHNVDAANTLISINGHDNVQQTKPLNMLSGIGTFTQGINDVEFYPYAYCCCTKLKQLVYCQVVLIRHNQKKV